MPTIISPVVAIAELFSSAGAADYLGEPVTVAEHLLQAGTLAESAGASPALIAAALLHDVGHLRGADALAEGIELSGRELMTGTDNNHGERGAQWLAQWFPASVTEPVRLHVAAKRYSALPSLGTRPRSRTRPSTPWACRAGRCTERNSPNSRRAGTRRRPSGSAAGTMRLRTQTPRCPDSGTTSRCSARWPGSRPGRYPAARWPG